jgi:hypothetical protein
MDTGEAKTSPPAASLQTVSSQSSQESHNGKPKASSTAPSKKGNDQAASTLSDNEKRVREQDLGRTEPAPSVARAPLTSDENADIDWAQFTNLLENSILNILTFFLPFNNN